MKLVFNSFIEIFNVSVNIISFSYFWLFFL